jgi:hypothetical protein
VTRAIVFVLPALAAIADPFLLSATSWLLRVSQVAAPPSPAVNTVTALAILASASGAMGVAFARALSLGRIGADVGSGRLLAHRAFAAPVPDGGIRRCRGPAPCARSGRGAWPPFWITRRCRVIGWAAPSKNKGVPCVFRFYRFLSPPH